MKNTITSCDICGTVFKEREEGHPHGRRFILEGNIILRLEGRGGCKYPPENLVLEVCEDPTKDCRVKAIDLLIKRVVESERAR